MTYVNLSDTDTSISCLINIQESGSEDVIYFSRGTETVAKLSLLDSSETTGRIGAARGLFVIPEKFDEWDDEILDMFEDTE